MKPFDLVHLAQQYYEASRDGWLWILGGLIILDVLTGLLKAWRFRVLNSSIGTKGFAKHSAVFLAMVFVYPVLTYIDLEEIAISMVAYASINYALSIVENLNDLGANIVPKSIYRHLERFKEQFEVDEPTDVVKGADNEKHDKSRPD